MSAPKLARVWLNLIGDGMELRADFNNDRHHAMMIKPPHGREDVARALEDLARNIRNDKELT